MYHKNVSPLINYLSIVTYHIINPYSSIHIIAPYSPRELFIL
nr:MAG TPA: hypothetical protein [Caudoviricetes sp.]